MKTFLERLGVCSWSLQPANASDLIADLETLQLRRVQIDLDAIRTEPKLWENFPELCLKHGIHVVSGMFRTVNEDYSSPQKMRETVGLSPDETWEDNWDLAQATADLAKKYGIRLVTFHAGFVPHDETDPLFEKMLHRIRLVADFFASRGIDLALETGQETALTMKDFLQKVGRVNVGINFDPTNLLIGDMSNPVEAVEILGSFIKQCHLKDGVRPAQTGVFGRELAVGTGEVNWQEFFRALQNINFTGYLFFEREAGEHRVEDIRWGREFVERVLAGAPRVITV